MKITQEQLEHVRAVAFDIVIDNLQDGEFEFAMNIGNDVRELTSLYNQGLELPGRLVDLVVTVLGE